MPTTCDLDGWNREHARFRRNRERLVAMKLQPRALLNNIDNWQQMAAFLLKRDAPVRLGDLDVPTMQKMNDAFETYFGLVKP